MVHVSDVGHVAQQVGHALFQRAEVFLRQRRLGLAAVHLERAHRCHHDHRVRRKPRCAALDVQEFLRAEVRAEAGFRDGVLAHFERRAGGNYRIAAVGNIRKRSAVHERGRTFQCLHQIRLERVFEQRSHRAHRFEFRRGHRPVIVRVAHYNASQPRLEVLDGFRQAEHRHDLAGNGNVVAVFPRHAVGFAAQAVDNIPELPVVHIHAAPPRDLAGVNAQRVPLMDMVVQHGRQEVVGRADRVKVAGKVEVDVLHRHHLRVSAARGAAFDAEHRAQRRLPERHRDFFADAAEAVRQSDSGGSFALSRRRRRDGGDQHQPAVLPALVAHHRKVDLRLILAVRLHILFRNACFSGDLVDRSHLALLRDLNIAQITHFVPRSPCDLRFRLPCLRLLSTLLTHAFHALLILPYFRRQ